MADQKVLYILYILYIVRAPYICSREMIDSVLVKMRTCIRDHTHLDTSLCMYMVSDRDVVPYVHAATVTAMWRRHALMSAWMSGSSASLRRWAAVMHRKTPHDLPSVCCAMPDAEVS